MSGEPIYWTGPRVSGGFTRWKADTLQGAVLKVDRIKAQGALPEEYSWTVFSMGSSVDAGHKLSLLGAQGAARDALVAYAARLTETAYRIQTPVDP